MSKSAPSPSLIEQICSRWNFNFENGVAPPSSHWSRLCIYGVHTSRGRFNVLADDGSSFEFSIILIIIVVESAFSIHSGCFLVLLISDPDLLSSPSSLSTAIRSCQEEEILE
ncbi:hypothetical protein LWI28_028089 [Acer negundo]|uniref:Uncharacterized protein n=1 Tax=Acer negundo TaxID=4023 RepID=A0AAD5JGF9_ACENE|nr:hypothetical protein LWI28_028089 [Acer negundo]KAK4859126.1 hypothetical protein QYF36_027305 [Acer negundo]